MIKSYPYSEQLLISTKGTKIVLSMILIIDNRGLRAGTGTS